MTDTTIRKYEIGDAVTFIVEDTDTWPGRIVGPSDNQFCTACHCCPPDPDHEFDGSLCCPGPWYRVEAACACGCGAQNTVSFAEHELTAIATGYEQEGPFS